MSPIPPSIHFMPPIASDACCASLTPWVTQMGLQNAFVVAAAVALAQSLTVFVFIRHGQRMRRASAGRFRHYEQERIAAGLGH